MRGELMRENSFVRAILVSVLLLVVVLMVSFISCGQKEEANEKFGFLLEAYKYGAPVHGGMGLGLDRTITMMLGGHDIREVIAFPKNKSAQCPMDGSPSGIDKTQMKELHIKLDIVKTDK